MKIKPSGEGGGRAPLWEGTLTHGGQSPQTWVKAECWAVLVPYFLFSASRLLRIKGRVITVDIFQNSHICISDIFVSLKCVLMFIRKL